MDYEGSVDALSIDALASEIKRECKEQCEFLPRERQDSLERLMLSLQVSNCSLLCKNKKISCTSQGQQKLGLLQGYFSDYSSQLATIKNPK